MSLSPLPEIYPFMVVKPQSAPLHFTNCGLEPYIDRVIFK